MEIIARYCSLPSDRVSEWTGTEIHGLDDGVLFVLANWSGDSLAALRKVSDSLTHTTVKMHVLDIDTVSSSLRKTLGPLNGRGETFWVKDGEIVGHVSDFRGDQWQSVVKNLNASWSS